MKQEFLKIDNILMMWEVMSEEPIIQKHTNKDLIINIFIANCSVFFNQEIHLYPHIKLLDLNKKCILAFLEFMKTFGQQQKIMIHQEDHSNHEIITIEDLKSQRQLEFNTKLNEMQNSFDELHRKPRPPTPVFEDAIKDTSLSSSEMEMNLQSVIQQRKYDVLEVKKTVQFAETSTSSLTEDFKKKLADLENKIHQLQESINESQQTLNELKTIAQKDNHHISSNGL
jgi:hypothetical protein